MKRILYVEDNVDTAHAVMIVLKREGYFVDVAHTGKDGVEKAKNNDWDLILLDVMLPDISGWEIYCSLKPEVPSKYAMISVIPISGERLNELKNGGICAYILKPFDKKDLVCTISKVLKTADE